MPDLGMKTLHSAFGVWDHQMAEPGADDNRSVGGPVHQLERHRLVAGELEHGPTCPADVDAADLLVTETGVEGETIPAGAMAPGHPVG
jgi:hypothetical protein